MATEVLMPQMGESIAEGTITTWLVAVGDEVKRDQPLFEISTDKVDAEIPSPADGVLLEVRYSDGETSTRSQTLPAPVSTQPAIYASAASLLERTHAGSRPISLIGVTLAGLVSAGVPDPQLDLFLGPP